MYINTNTLYMNNYSNIYIQVIQTLKQQFYFLYLYIYIYIYSYIYYYAKAKQGINLYTLPFLFASFIFQNKCRLCIINCKKLQNCNIHYSIRKGSSGSLPPFLSLFLSFSFVVYIYNYIYQFDVLFYRSKRERELENIINFSLILHISFVIYR